MGHPATLYIATLYITRKVTFDLRSQNNLFDIYIHQYIQLKMKLWDQ